MTLLESYSSILIFKYSNFVSSTSMIFWVQKKPTKTSVFFKACGFKLIYFQVNFLIKVLWLGSFQLISKFWLNLFSQLSSNPFRFCEFFSFHWLLYQVPIIFTLWSGFIFLVGHCLVLYGSWVEHPLHFICVCIIRLRFFIIWVNFWFWLFWFTLSWSPSFSFDFFSWFLLNLFIFFRRVIFFTQLFWK